MSQIRDQWGSRLGFILAASGSAIGLGNLWKFPYITWANNGGAFVLVYLICIAAVGLPIMMAEILIGRSTQKSPVGAMRAVAGPAWSWVGGLGVLTGFVILGYYTVIAGWALRYFAQCVRWSLSDFSPEASSGDAFGAFAGNGVVQAALVLAFMCATVFVVHRGVGRGIERVSRVLMPILFLILIVLLLRALTLDGAGRAVGFIFRPNFADLEPLGVLEALGHSFFTLSLGMGAMITYGSYLRRSESVVRASGLVVLLDTLIALVATTIMFSVIFSVPGLEDEISGSTVGMLFIALPGLFYQEVPLGALLAPLFYLLVCFAALTSTISLLEVVSSYFIDQRNWKRSSAVLSCGAATLVLSLLCALSFGANGILTEFSLIFRGTPNAKLGLFDHLDYLASNWFLPIGGFFITLVCGWVVSRKLSEGELVDETTPSWFHYGIWRFCVRYLAPVAVAAIIIAVLLGLDFSKPLADG
ncbi:MAG: sodium-dependent transporter [bacterium]|nr:sodium-dependent transporter [bacterium]